MPEIESHPFPALLPPEATVMMMGTFPPKAEKHAMQFHYPNFINDMWRVYGLVFFNDAAHFQKIGEKAFDAAKIKAFLRERGIASCPTVLKAVREQDNASDKFLRVFSGSPSQPPRQSSRNRYGILCPFCFQVTFIHTGRFHAHRIQITERL